MIHVDQQKCIGDGFCVHTCPSRDFYMGDDGKAHVVGPETFRCIECGHCVAVCPVNAITLKGDASTPIPATPATFSGQLEVHMKTRRSIRWFKKTPVPRQALQQALETARYAPTAKNTQGFAWLATDKPETVKAIAEHTASFLLQSPDNKSAGEAYFQGVDRVLRGAPTVLIGHAPVASGLSLQDCGATLAYMELLLHAQGLGSCWAGYVTNACAHVPALRALLGLAEGRHVLGGLMVGYPMERFLRIPGRKAAQILWI